MYFEMMNTFYCSCLSWTLRCKVSGCLSIFSTMELCF
uniref:Uncharacterized protein n=1 Tax=Rhizophora mucronata TaxID=61149 RepID=A0A2P2IJU5_RHIMU